MEAIRVSIRTFKIALQRIQIKTNHYILGTTTTWGWTIWKHLLADSDLQRRQGIHLVTFPFLYFLTSPHNTFWKNHKSICDVQVLGYQRRGKKKFIFFFLLPLNSCSFLPSPSSPNWKLAKASRRRKKKIKNSCFEFGNFLNLGISLSRFFLTTIRKGF